MKHSYFKGGGLHSRGYNCQPTNVKTEVPRIKGWPQVSSCRDTTSNQVFWALLVVPRLLITLFGLVLIAAKNDGHKP